MTEPDRADPPPPHTTPAAPQQYPRPAAHIGVVRIEATLEGPVALGGLRTFLRDASSLVGLESSETLVVITHELVKNAEALGESGIKVAVQRTPVGGARIEVRDHGYGIPTVDARPLALGLRIVEELSDRWGVDQFLPGKIVWAERDPDSTRAA